MKKYRIVKYYEGFFNSWAYRLEKYYWPFGWFKVAGNGLTRSIPKSWQELNIVEEKTIEI